ncbi:MAG: hypothetical protein KDB10_18310 [Acidimicrobiales bacterium]|nr:hypothetical protein [Acidimicrobiales bacterium]MCB9372304.1 hypothetical protein [Microthrixaceae bacterium]
MRRALRRLPVVGEWARHDVDPPRWQGPPAAKRVLVEEEDAELRSAMGAALRAAGYRTAECAGPGWHGDGRCPMVESDGCDAVDTADAVLQVLVASDEPMREVRATLHDERPALPVVVFAPRATVERDPGLAEGATVATGPLSRAAVVRAVEDAIGPP